ncbi:MAG: 50S ribosomal protein L9 [Oscillospiraceae bacterium]|nr:50S ribosomal protein L9 [Oscillospiraceae bacterium]
MEVLLLQDISGSGKKGDIVKVKDGYAKNFLFPKKLAVPATAQIVKEKQSRDKAAQFHREQEIEDAKKLADKLSGKTVTVTAKAGATGKLFGAVTAKEIASAISFAYNFQADKRKIHLDEDIKSFGEYDFELKLHTGIVAKMKVKVDSGEME